MKILYLFLPLLLSGCVIVANQRTTAPKEQAPIDYSDPVLNNRQVLLVGDLNKQTAEETIQKLLYLDKESSEPIDLYLFTPGGDLLSAFSIEQVIKSLHSKVNTHALAECNSGGAFILAAGTGERVAFADSLIVVHGMVINGKHPDGKMVKILEDYYTGVWKRRTHMPESWLPIPHGKNIFLTGREALQYGLVDKIIDK